MSDENDMAAFLGSSSGAKTMADGTLRVQIDFPPIHAVDAFTAFGSPGSPVAVARVTNEAAVEADRPKEEKPYGQEAQALFQSTFFRSPPVWRAVGSDAEYLEWVKHQPSAVDGNFSEYHDSGEKYCIPAHVRRVEFGSGTAEKPPYSAIPLTNGQHQLAHQQGDIALGDDDWWAKMRIRYVHTWAWETAKKRIQAEHPHFSCESWSMIPPKVVEEWAIRHNIHQYLPQIYKGHAKSEERQEASEA